MRSIFFSDLHIKAPGDSACKLFQKLCESAEVESATHIFLLGDIFDLLIGEHHAYFEKYHLFFNNIVKLLDSNKKIIYLEGNHDFHFKNSLAQYLKSKTSKAENFQYLTNGINFEFSNMNYYICHGDEVDDTNESFKRWKKIYTSNEFAFLVNKILRYKFIDYLGAKVSNNSKSRGSKSFNYETLRERYREGAKRLVELKSVDGVICGHTHIQESFDLGNNKRYYNCGHPLSNKNFLYFDGENFSFINLADS